MHMSLRALITLVVTFGLVGGCGDADFSGGVSKMGGSGKPKTCTKPPCNTLVIDDEGIDPNTVKVRYGKDVKPMVADMLFVVDNSVSMSRYADRVAQGLAAIKKETFPESTRIAVMTTMAAEDAQAASLKAHADIWKNRDTYGSCINKEPGFLSLVNKAAVDTFKACRKEGAENASKLAEYQGKYSKAVCDASWFKPFDLNQQGDRCFTAALQSPYHAVGCEPGLLALEQIVARNNGKPLFRDNAALSVIFVSDEQAGCEAASTRGDPTKAAETAERIKKAILTNSKVVSIKFHGITPDLGNAEIMPTNTLSYKRVIESIGGKWFNVLEPAQNYNGMVDQLIQAAAEVTVPEFYIPSTAKAVKAVEVDGVATQNYQFDVSKSKVTVQGLDPQKKVEIIIRFE
jgi:hypothetical protein